MARRGGEADFCTCFDQRERERLADGHNANASPRVDPVAAHVTEAFGINPIPSVTGVSSLLTTLTSVDRTCSFILRCCRKFSKLQAAAAPAL